jgi:4-amino-4-deoxy-L-arabinose transferase-like glycosyltransferase
MHTTINPWERLALVVIFAIGAWLRFQHIGDIEVNVDQAYPIWQAIQTLDAGQFPLAGQGTSVLFANPPLTGYFFVPFIALVRHPIAAYTLTLTLNTFAIWLAYRALRWLIGTRPALIGALLFAVNPWIVEDSRRTWVQSLAPFFVCLIFWALVPVLTGQTRHPKRRTLIALVGLALFAHTYLLAYALIAPAGVLIVLYWRRVPKRPLWIGIAFFAVLMALYGIGLARQWDDTSQRADQFTSGQAKLSGEALGHALRLVTGAGYADVRGQRAPEHDANLRDTLSDAAHILWTLAIGVGILRALWSFRRSVAPPLRGMERGPGGEVNAGPVLLIWFLLPVLMMSYVSRVVHPFYLLLTVPAGHGLAAWGAAWIVSPQSAQRSQGKYLNVSRLWRPMLISALLVFTTAINGLNTIRFAQNTAAFPGEDLPETLPLQEASQLRARLLEAGAPDHAVFSLMDEWSPIAFVGRDFRTENTATYGRAALVPPSGGIYLLFEKPGDPAPVTPPYAQQAEPPLILTDGTRITLWRVTPDDLRIDHPADTPSDIDVSFAGWTLEGDLTSGAVVTLDTFWRIDALHPERGIWSFLAVAHVMDTNGAQIAADQGNAVSALTWAVGDRMVQRLTLTIPADAAGPLALDVSLFDPVRVRDDGTPGINAIFHIAYAQGGIDYTPIIAIFPPE